MRTSQVLRRGQASGVRTDAADSDDKVYNRGLDGRANQQRGAGDNAYGLGDPAEDVWKP